MSAATEGSLHVYAAGPPSAGESSVTSPVGQPLSDAKTGARSACPSRPATALHSRKVTCSVSGSPLALSPSR